MTKEKVIVLHGLRRTSRHMRKLALHLEECGYAVLNIDYPSTKLKLEELVEVIWFKIRPLVSEGQKIHFVGHSMGGLLIRMILHKYRLEALGRVVQIGTPNRGSEVVTLLKNKWLFKKVFGPAGQQLSEEISKVLGKVDYELGGIAGNFNRFSLFRKVFKTENDGSVSVESTKIDGMKDHIVIKTAHTLLPYNKEVQRQTAHFLKHGKFTSPL